MMSLLMLLVLQMGAFGLLIMMMRLMMMKHWCSFCTHNGAPLFEEVKKNPFQGGELPISEPIGTSSPFWKRSQIICFSRLFRRSLWLYNYKKWPEGMSWCIKWNLLFFKGVWRSGVVVNDVACRKRVDCEPFKLLRQCSVFECLASPPS